LGTQGRRLVCARARVWCVIWGPSQCHRHVPTIVPSTVTAPTAFATVIKKLIIEHESRGTADAPSPPETEEVTAGLPWYELPTGCSPVNLITVIGDPIRHGNRRD